jgi:hypothetical protein
LFTAPASLEQSDDYAIEVVALLVALLCFDVRGADQNSNLNRLTGALSLALEHQQPRNRFPEYIGILAIVGSERCGE